ncbi:MAG: helix-turn-helix transcriptional regulator [Deltaproteobacteria bacterium]|nr:helix-turn-helix transcriptional regulator [Deltaproteobacteria bacterium]
MPRKARAKPEDDYIRQVGATIRDLRVERGLQQEQLGARAGIAGSRISEIERGIVDTSLTRLRAIASALDIPPSQLFHHQELAAEGDHGTARRRTALTRSLTKLDAHQLDVLQQVTALLIRR